MPVLQQHLDGVTEGKAMHAPVFGIGNGQCFLFEVHIVPGQGRSLGATQAGEQGQMEVIQRGLRVQLERSVVPGFELVILDEALQALHLAQELHRFFARLLDGQVAIAALRFSFDATVNLRFSTMKDFAPPLVTRRPNPAIAESLRRLGSPSHPRQGPAGEPYP